MNTKLQGKSQIKVITGNAAAAIAAKLARPDVVAAYPITPQTEIIEQISQFHANGEMDCELITVEGENSAMNAVMAASLAGGRVFTATSSWGLVFMYDAVLATAGARAPVVMVNVNRETPGIIAVSSGQQDMISTRDAGWIFLIAEDCQEVLDMVLQAYRLAEDYDIQVPVMVHYDGFYLSYLSEGVNVPFQEDADKFLSVLNDQPERTKLVPGGKLGCGSHGILEGYLELRHKHVSAMERAKATFNRIDQEFYDIFGRSYGGVIEEYRMDDADVVLVGSGSMCGTIKTVVDVKREEGLKIGLVKMRMYRPFPGEAMVKALKGKKAIGVVDRSLCFGHKGGPIYTELKAFETQLEGAKMISFIDGIANTDITTANVGQMIDTTCDLAAGKAVREVTWVSYPAAQEEEGFNMTEQKKGKLTKVLDHLKHEDPFSKGVAFCPGCGLELLLRFIPQVLGNDIVMTGTPSCSAPVLLGQNNQSWHKLSYFGTLMTGAAANATGLARYYRKKGIENTVVCFNGDGTAADIGFGNLSGAAERNEPFIYICYDNEGYMNTGIQKSGTTPFGASTTTTPLGSASKGKNLRRMNLALKMAMHKIPYAATATLSDLDDLAKKLLKAKEAKERGFAFLHVFAPCTTGWGYAPENTIEVCRRAVKTNYFPLWEAENGKIRMTKTVKKPKPVSTYTELIKKFAHLNEADLQILQDDIDYEYCMLGGLSLLEGECQLPVSAED